MINCFKVKLFNFQDQAFHVIVIVRQAFDFKIMAAYFAYHTFNTYFNSIKYKNIK